jgi:hypothetical protein
MTGLVRVQTVLLLLVAIVSANAPRADAIVPSAYRIAAAKHEIPPRLLYAVALAESGRGIETIRRPWPWTLNIAGQGHYFDSRVAAWQALDEALRAGQDRVDVGLMQINWRYHRHSLGNAWMALEPYHNLAVGADILSRCYRERREWWASVGCYHAPSNAKRARQYRDRVVILWQALETSE